MFPENARRHKTMPSISYLFLLIVSLVQIFLISDCLPVDGLLTSDKNKQLQHGKTTLDPSNRPDELDKGMLIVDTLNDDNSREVRETHHTTCQVTSEELVATAQATVTRVLKGLCNSREMEDRFLNLESRLTEQLNLIKTLLVKLEATEEARDQNMKKGQRKVLSTLLRNCPLNGAENMNTLVKPVANISDSDTGTITEESNEELIQLSDASHKSRDVEINLYNSTIHTESSILTPGVLRTVFTYYWRVPRITYKLNGWSHRRSLRSPSFYISPEGYRMYLRIYPRQSDENVFIHVGLTRGDYDDTLSWPFKLKHRIHILDQDVNGLTEDIVSRIWNPVVLCSGFNWQRPMTGDSYECVGLGFPHDIVRSRNYIRDDNLIIKLVVYME